MDYPNIKRILELNVIHVHPLEETLILDEYAYLPSDRAQDKSDEKFYGIVSTSPGMIKLYYKACLPCLAHTAKMAAEYYNVDYITFTPDGQTIPSFMTFPRE